MAAKQSTCKAVLLLGFGGYDKLVIKQIPVPSVGDRVAALGQGMWQEKKSISANQVFKIPDKMSFEEGAAIPVNYITAHMMLFDFGNLRPSQSVLVHMAAGGVGIAVTQLCKTVDNVTLFGTASAAKHDFIREQGVTYPIDYRTQDYVEEVKKIKPKGVNIVLDPLGGADSVKAVNLLCKMGRVVHYGGANMMAGEKISWWVMLKMWYNMVSVKPFDLILKNRGVCGYHLGKFMDDLDIVHPVVKELFRLSEDGKIKPKIDSVWSFEDVVKANARIVERKNIGKVILTPFKPDNA